MWKKPNVFITLPTGETKKISNLSDAPEQEEEINPQDNDEEEPTMKRLRILVEGNPKPYKLKIRPYTSVRDILAYLQLDEDYILYSLSDPTNHFSSSMEALYDYVKDNEKFIARAPAKIDIDEAIREMKSFAVVDDDPPPEPIDTTDSDEYIRSFFK